MSTLGTTFMVIDDTENPAADVFAFVGVLIPIEKYDAIRTATNRFTRELEGVADNTVTIPPELHGSAMFGGKKPVPWATDAHRLRAYEMVADLINQHRLTVIRSAYVKSSLRKTIGADKPNALCFMNLLWMVQPELERTYIVPMFDGFDASAVRAIGGASQVTHVLRATPGFAPSQLSISNADRILDPVFIDSGHSTLMQVTDVAAYLLNALDNKRIGKSADTDYKRGVLTAAERLDLSLVAGVNPLEMKDMTPRNTT